jgi:hypothetical protein
MNEETYVYDGEEVRLTGRVAERVTKSKVIHQLVEIRPVNNFFDWNKWVNPTELYKVK